MRYLCLGPHIVPDQDHPISSCCYYRDGSRFFLWQIIEMVAQFFLFFLVLVLLLFF